MGTMCCLSSKILVACTIVLSIGAIEARDINDIKCKPSCTYLYRCFPYYNSANEVVYAIEDGVCKVFANGCMFSSYNCNRINSCLPGLESVPKEKCQERCANCDNEKENIVCATFTPSNDNDNNIDHQIQYANKCEADKAACKTGIPYAFITKGSCT